MSKVLDTILRIKDDPNADWKSELERIDVYEDVKVLYQKKWPTKFCNSVLAFIVLAYDNQSGWVSLHKDRWDDKEKIASRIGLKITDKNVIDIIQNNNAAVNQVAAWFIEYQADWRWDTVIACFEYHAEMMRFAKTKTQDQLVEDTEEGGKKIMGDVDIKTLAEGNVKKGSNIELAINMRKKGEALLVEMREEFVQLDTILVKEGKRKMTDATKINSWEYFIADLRGHTK